MSSTGSTKQGPPSGTSSGGLPRPMGNGAQQLKMALALHQNQKSAWTFAASMGGLMVLFCLFHWSRYASAGLTKSPVLRLQIKVARICRNGLVRPVPGFTSLGHALLVAIYLAINIALTVTFIDWSSLIGIGKRCGWMALTNIAFITFLALKNTPLAFLTAYSYERLNQLHQIGGYTTVTYIFIHLTVLTRAFMKLHMASIILMEGQVHGIIAACAMLVTLFAAVVIRKLRYELFYVIHILMYILIIINVALHQPDFAKGAYIITTLAGSLWACDRLFRGSRIIFYSLGNKATITTLAGGGTRIILSRSPARAVPGNHCFLWIPSIRLIETHPFTIVSSTPTSLELVISAYDGFTRDLHEYALKNPGITLRASVDGPYGATPDFVKSADKVMLIAGGSGASFTFGVALDMLKKLGTSTKTTIQFIWAVKDNEMISWYSNELTELQASPLVTVHLYITRSSVTAPSLPIDEKITQQSNPQQSDPKTLSPELDIEKTSPVSQTNPTPWDSVVSLDLINGRPDVRLLIDEFIGRAGNDERVAIAACGPNGLMTTVRNATAGAIKVKGPSVELHCEQFGW